MAKNDKAFMKTIQERIGVDKFIKGVGEIDYQRRTGKMMVTHLCLLQRS